MNYESVVVELGSKLRAERKKAGLEARLIPAAARRMREVVFARLAGK
jgi:hypothetical protein